MTRLTTCPDAESVAQRAAAHVVRQLRRANEQRGVAHLALSGGTTPGRTYELLGAQPQALAGVELWFADERCVPPRDEESNYRLVQQTLLAGAQLTPERVHRMEGEAGPHEGARRYAEALVEHVAPESASPPALPALDLIVLGIGPDGHVASLFPGAATLDAGEDAICLGVEDSPKPPPQRITLSLAVLRAARECVLLATGSSKAAAVSAMLGDPSREVPASLLRRERLTVIVDDDAAPPGAPRR
ncbi:MAG: pgl [Solirubrobacterales bacterium]|nr:pgl [Solirubrobacterales bacterium]